MSFTTLGLIKSTAKVLFGGAGVVALVTIAYTMWIDSNERSAAYGESKASLAFMTGQLVESKSENQKLKIEKGNLQLQIDDLRKQLLTEQSENKYDKKLLDESELKTKQLEERVAYLSVSLKNADPCAPLRKEINALEKDLQRPDYMGPRLTATQRAQGQSSLDKKYRSLDVCQSPRR